MIVSLTVACVAKIVTYISSQEDWALEKGPCGKMSALFFYRKVTISDFHHVHVIVGEEIDRTEVLHVDCNDIGNIGPLSARRIHGQA
jgi:hypothetical protein